MSFQADRPFPALGHMWIRPVAKPPWPPATPVCWECGMEWQPWTELVRCPVRVAKKNMGGPSLPRCLF